MGPWKTVPAVSTIHPYDAVIAPSSKVDHSFLELNVALPIGASVRSYQTRQCSAEMKRKHVIGDYIPVHNYFNACYYLNAFEELELLFSCWSANAVWKLRPNACARWRTASCWRAAGGSGLCEGSPLRRTSDSPACKQSHAKRDPDRPWPGTFPSSQPPGRVIPPSQPPPPPPLPVSFLRSWLLLQPVNGRTSAVYGIAPFFFFFLFLFACA